MFQCLFSQLVTVIFFFSSLTRAQVQVKTEQGEVQGFNATDGNYFTFHALYYAGPPTGENRFKGPTPPPQYPGVYHAAKTNLVCAQPGPNGIIGEENCLTVNIFTNNTTTKNPVLVWLVSDEYSTSVNVQSFKSLVEQGIVVVQMNHRLSIFGFLCLGVPDAPGNAALKDVVQGLKWIKSNIEGFGGDPNNVILFGHGSGAAMVDLITMSPLAENLVHKAITQSGSALSPWAVAYNPVESARAVGEKLNYTKVSNEQLAKNLASTDLERLTIALSNFEFTNNSILFAPCIENLSLIENDSFLTDAPINILRSGNYSHIPYLSGYTNREGTIRAEEAAYNGWLDKMQENFTEFLQVDLDLSTNLTSASRSIREFYFAERNINMETIEDYLDYQGDTMILVSVIRNARERALTSTAPVRLFEFAYRGTRNSNWGMTTIPLTGARHGAVLDFLLENDLRTSTVDTEVSASLIRRFVRFMREGDQDPNPNQAEFLPMSRNSSYYLQYIGGDGSTPGETTFADVAKVNPHQQRMLFWDDLYFRYYVPPRPVSAAFSLTSCISVLIFALTLLMGVKVF